MKNNVPQTQYDKTIRRRGWLLMAASLLIAFGLQIVGILLNVQLSGAARECIAGVVLFCCVLPLGLLVMNPLMNRMTVSELNSIPMEQMGQYLLESKENAEQTVVEEIPRLRRLRKLAERYAIMLGVFGAVAALCSGMVYDSAWGTLAVFVSAFLLLSALSCIRFPVPKVLFEENKTYVSAADYPRLYALARRAAEAMGREGKIAISLLGDMNGGIARIGDTYSIQIGTMLLELLSEGELYSVLIHEFAHMTEENADGNREREHYYWVSNGRNPHFLSGLVALNYLTLDTKYMYQMFLYDYACSVLVERNADRAMAEHGDPAYAASALLKMKYYELYEWEQGTEDSVPFYAPEEAPVHVIRDRVEPFRKAMEQRMEEWNELAECEIIARNASHPTLKMRLETLGVTEYRIAESADDEEFIAECRKGREYVEALILERGAEEYKTERIEGYVKPMERIAAWEQAGKPLIAAEYADVVRDLRSVGRVTEAMALCERAVNELDNAAGCYGYFMRGLYRLHCYDPAGMDDLYRAIANNSNYIDEGIEAIGHFCCITGRQEELDTYRERAMDVGKWQKDVQAEMNVLRKKDRLVPEQLPEELMAGLLDTVRESDDGSIEAVYLVRKVITEDFFASAVVVRFVKNVRPESYDFILRRLFNYLDTCSDWQFTLFDYNEVKKAKVETVPNSLIYTPVKET